jgi:signal-transduction protein with cAMP-binding, CBS, and nucleotidyltransferase domain
MLVKDLPFETIPHATCTDTVHEALFLMQRHAVAHIAVINENKFIGTASAETLLEMDGDILLGELQYLFQNISIKNDAHFLNAVSLAATHNLSAVPITDEENNVTGTISALNLLQSVTDFMRLQEPCGMIILKIDPLHYSFAEIGKIVESNGAQIIRLNTSFDEEKEIMFVTIGINQIEISDIVASFQRYKYHVWYYSGEELYINELKLNYENLINYLNV